MVISTIRFIVVYNKLTSRIKRISCFFNRATKLVNYNLRNATDCFNLLLIMKLFAIVIYSPTALRRNNAIK